MEFDLFELMLSVAGGIFGAAVGALPVWILCGLAVLIGASLNASNGFDSFTNVVAWGHFIGPHTAFTGGTAAAAFAARKGTLANGRDIAASLAGLGDPKVLLVGGIFGGLGYVILYGISLVPNYTTVPWTNTIALAIILDMILIRLVLGKTGVFGRIEGKASRWVATDTASWVPYQSKPLMILLLSFAVSMASTHLSLLIPNSMGIIFGVATFTLIFMQFGFQVPVTHHIALSASFATILTQDPVWGISIGCMAGFLAEYFACLFVYHGDTHIDPPTMAILAIFTLLPALQYVGLLELEGPVLIASSLFVNSLLFFSLYLLKKEKNKEAVVATV